MVAVGGAICIMQAAGDAHLMPKERRRALRLGGALLVLGVGGAATKRSGGVVARAVRACPPLTVISGLLATAANPLVGGARSPAHFAGGVAVAIAGGLLDPRRARVLGGLAGGLWIAQARLSQFATPERPQPDRMWAEFTYPLQMIGNASVGSAFGAGALGTRSLQHGLRRLESHVRDLDDLRSRLERAVQPFLEALDAFAEAGAAHADSGRGALVQEAAVRSRDRLADVTAALHAARRAASPDATPIDALVAHVARHDARGLDVTVLGSSEGAQLSPRAQLAAHIVLLRALSNARRHGTRGVVTIDMRRPSPSVLRIQIRSPVKDVADAHPRFGQGTRDSQALLHSLGGDLVLTACGRSFLVDARIPISEAARLASHSSVADDLLEHVERAAWDLLRLNGVMVLASSWGGGQYVRHRRRSQLLSTALPLAAEAIRLVGRGRRAPWLEALLAATVIVEAASQHGEFAPVAGWGGMLLTTYALQDRPRHLHVYAAALAAATISSYRGPADGFPLMAGREGIGMVLPGVVTLFLRRGFGRVDARERRLAALIDELEQLQGVAEDVAFRTHGFAEPIENALGLLDDHPAAIRLQTATRNIRVAGSELSRALEDRAQLVDDLADALAYRVWPAVVETRDAVHSPAAVRTTGIVREVAARRRVLESMALAADSLLEHLEPDFLGRWPLETVELSISEADDAVLLVSLLPRPRIKTGTDTLDRLTNSLAALGGTVRDGFDDGQLTFTIALRHS
jgi:hypothetical protein